MIIYMITNGSNVYVYDGIQTKQRTNNNYVVRRRRSDGPTTENDRLVDVNFVAFLPI